MASLLIDDQQKQAQTHQAIAMAHARHQKPQVMHGHDDSSSDDDEHPPRDLGNVFGAPPKKQQLKGESEGNGVKLPSVFGNENDLSAIVSKHKQQPVGKAAGRKNPFNQRRQTASEDDLADAPSFGGGPSKQQMVIQKGDRKQTSGTLNRNESKTQLTSDFEAGDSREVELRAQQNENSQLFMDSQFTQSGMPVLNRFNNQGFDQEGDNYDEELANQIRSRQKVTVNLEDAVLEEQKLFQILESLRNNCNASLYCDDWWDVTETGHFATIVAYQIIKDPMLKQIMMKAQKFEAIAIGIVQFYHLLAYEQTTIDTQTSVNTYLKNLMFYIHQKFLIVICITLSRVVNKKQSSWETTLQNTVDTKILKKLQNKREATQMLRVYCSNCENIIRNICKANGNKKIFKIIDEWLNAMNRVPIDKVRDVLYNIEQFKGDALKLPDIKSSFGKKGTDRINSYTSSKMGATGKEKDGPVYGAGAQSSGSMSSGDSTSAGASKKMLSSGNGGQTSLTGKNPFAILKASAIASPATAVFPNNFANLPKVSPPFLDPLSEEDADKYTLVLDLDETLIHNVEYQNDSFFLVRPGCVQFIETMAKYYEIVIFTAALQEYADQVIDQIDVGKNIKYRLYRQHTSQNGPFLVKDLSLLGRDVNKTIIIDNISDNFILQPDNGIFISTWYDDMRDKFFEEITPLLCEIVDKQIPDVRKALRHYRDQVLRQVANGVKNPSINFV